MRGDDLTVETRHDRPADAALFGADAVTTRTFDTPEFAGITLAEPTGSGPTQLSLI